MSNVRLRPCPVCEAERAEHFWRKGTMQLVRCTRCCMVYVDPVEEKFASGLFYQDRPVYLSSAKLESDYASVRFERELRLFRRWCRKGDVLDVGCSTGAFLYQIKVRYAHDYTLLGTDLPGPALNYAETRGIPTSRDDFLQAPSVDARFDAITFWAVMEHLVEPRAFLHISAKLLRPGGHCFILVPNLQSLAVRLLGSKYRYILPEHLNYFEKATLHTFVHKEPAFEMVDSGSTHFNPVVIWQDWRSPKAFVSDEDRARLLQRTTAWKQNTILRPMKFVYRVIERLLGALNLADNLFVVLRRK